MGRIVFGLMLLTQKEHSPVGYTKMMRSKQSFVLGFKNKVPMLCDVLVIHLFAVTWDEDNPLAMQIKMLEEYIT